MQELTKADPPSAVKEAKESRDRKAENATKLTPAKVEETAIVVAEGKKKGLLGFSSEAARERQRKVEAYKKLHKIDEIGRAGSGSVQSRGQTQPSNRQSSSTVTTLQPS